MAMRQYIAFLSLCLLLACSSPITPEFDFEFLAGDWIGHDRNLVECAFSFAADGGYSYTEKYQAVALYGEIGTVSGRVRVGEEMGRDIVWVILHRNNSAMPVLIGTEWVIEIILFEDQRHFVWNNILFRKIKDR